MAEQLRQAADQIAQDGPADVIEMTKSIPTSKKKQRAVVWTAYSRRQGRVVAYHIGDRGVASAMTLCRRVKRRIPNIATIYTDANSCYRLAFQRCRVFEPHVQTKAQTHLMEASNSSIRDNLARFDRRPKRYSKSLEMLN
jgi:IS1 family transposase